MRGIVAVLLSMVDGMSVQNIKNLNIEKLLKPKVTKQISLSRLGTGLYNKR